MVSFPLFYSSLSSSLRLLLCSALLFCSSQSQEYRILAGYRESGAEIPLSRVVTLLNPSREKKILFIDIGSGEGHVIEYFARHIDCECLGVESDPLCMKRAIQRIQESNLQDRVTFDEEDAETFPFGASCEGYDEVIVYMFLSSFGYSIMGRKLLLELPIGSRVVTAANPIGTYWKPLCAWIGNEQDLTLYLSVVTSEAKQSLLVSPPPHPVHESRWRHPPPGSYFPQPLEEAVRVIPSETSPTEAIRLCQEYFQSETRPRPLSSPAHAAPSSRPSTTPSVSTHCHQPTLPRVPPPPPLPPPLPPSLPRIMKISKSSER
jgi:hypothetical protein